MSHWLGTFIIINITTGFTLILFNTLNISSFSSTQMLMSSDGRTRWPLQPKWPSTWCILICAASPWKGRSKGSSSITGGVFPVTPLTHLLSGPPSCPKPLHLCLCSSRALKNGTQSTQNQSRSLQLNLWILALVRRAPKLLRPDGQRTMGKDGQPWSLT